MSAIQTLADKINLLRDLSQKQYLIIDFVNGEKVAI